MRAALMSALLSIGPFVGAAAAQGVPQLALTPEQLAGLPQRAALVEFGNPPSPHQFEGPLIWDVLVSSGTVDPAAHRDAVRQVLLLRGADGYTATVALAELAPDFANRPAILAIRMDGAALSAPRAILPGEKRAGRSVRDVAAIGLETLGVDAAGQGGRR